MTWTQWAPLALVCLLGAVSPGPSLAVVTRHTISGGSAAGLLCAVSHGVGILIWASLMVAGVGFLILQHSVWFTLIQVLGGLYLVYLGLKMLASAKAPREAMNAGSTDSDGGAALDGLVIALSNPKIAVFFAALFSQFIRPDAPWTEKVTLALTAAVIDALWYALVAVMLSRSMALEYLREHTQLLNRIFGTILIVLAVSVMVSTG